MEYELYKKTEVSESLYHRVRNNLIWAFAVRVEEDRFFIKRMINASSKEVKKYIDLVLS